jgi:hypothetical protein
MYFRQKNSGQRRYLQIVEGYREGNAVRQRVIATLGRLDDLQQKGRLDGLLASGSKFAEHIAVFGAHKKGELQSVTSERIGPGMVFERLWQQTGIADCLHTLLAERRFRFDVERAVFLTVVHRLVDPGSDRAAEKWRRDFRLEDTETLDLHQLYRAMAWLGSPLPQDEQDARTPFAPRCTKDLIEEGLFERRRDLFSQMVLAFFDTTSLYFEGQGGRRLGRHGKSKDHRPDLRQMVLGLVLDKEGRPVCCELWPGNTTDVTTLLPVVARLRKRFRISKVCVVADRGMISNKTIAELEKQGLEYILGARMRAQKEVNQDVLNRAGDYEEVYPPRTNSKDPSPLRVKEVYVEDRRYVVCFNEEQERKDAADRKNIVEALRKQLVRGDKSLVGNKGYRKYLKSSGSGFAIDEDKVAEEARLDGKWVLRTNAKEPTKEVSLTYKQLWMVEALFRSVKSLLETRPIYHKCDETIRGHVFCSFLALLLMRELQDRMAARGWKKAEWADVLRDLGELSQTTVETHDGKRFLIRSEAKGWCGKTFQATGVAMPPTMTQLPNAEAP